MNIITDDLEKDFASHSLIGIGEGSHGTKEYQILRLKLIKNIYDNYHLNNDIIVFIEDNYFVLKSINNLPLTKFRDFVKIVRNSDMYSFYKSLEFIILLFYLHKKRVPIYGIDVQENPANVITENKMEESLVNYEKLFRSDMEMNERNKIREKITHTIINNITKLYRNPKSIVLAHNYHVSGYEKFPGLRIAQYSEEGTVRVAEYVNGKFNKFVTESFHYDFPVKKKLEIVKVRPNDDRTFQNNSFVLSGEEYDFKMFDYIFMFHKTTAIKISENK